MLDELRIAGLGVIEDTTLRLSPGFTVLTGETGAGKTMVVSALELLLGARADTSLVRAGSPAAVVEARVRPVPPGAATGGWVAADAPELIVRREVPAAGSSRVRIAGQLATVSALGEVLGRWGEVHAQTAHARLSRPHVQRDLLDRYAGWQHRRLLDAYGDTWQAWRESTGRLARLRADTRERAREIDRLEHEIAEIDRAGLDEHSEEDLDAELRRLANAEELAAAAGQAAALLDEQGASQPLGEAVGVLRGVAGHDPELDVAAERLEGLTVEAVELRRELWDYAETVQGDPERLAELRRIDRTLTELRRKYGANLDEVRAYREEAAVRLAELETAESDAEQLEQRTAKLEEDVVRRSEEIRAGRRRAADAMTQAVDAHLADLAMADAEFRVRLEPIDEPGPHGADRVIFELAANPGEPARPLAAAASGGERSRVALAVEVALADVDDARVLVFDEVDVGIGGATAMAIGEKLARLACGPADNDPDPGPAASLRPTATDGGSQGGPTAPLTDGGSQGGGHVGPQQRPAGRQVLCVTHLPQLAAFADVHHVVDKVVVGGRAVTTTRRVDEEDRAAELARMLSGDPNRPVGLDHARQLLTEAAARRGDIGTAHGASG